MRGLLLLSLIFLVYFPPNFHHFFWSGSSDIEKGSRWSTEIAKELESSRIGILCVTRDNIHSDWVLFEAGALSKSLEKSHVCPLLFGITNTDLAGPLKQFQTVEFVKGDMHKLMSVINSTLGENKLAAKTLDNVFEKWWPELENKISDILEDTHHDQEPVRSDREMLEEILTLMRLSSRHASKISPRAVKELLEGHIELHNQQAEGIGSYQEALDLLKLTHRPLNHIAKQFIGHSSEFDTLRENFENLAYERLEEDEPPSDDLPF